MSPDIGRYTAPTHENHLLAKLLHEHVCPYSPTKGCNLVFLALQFPKNFVVLNCRLFLFFCLFVCLLVCLSICLLSYLSIFRSYGQFVLGTVNIVFLYLLSCFSFNSCSFISHLVPLPDHQSIIHSKSRTRHRKWHKIKTAKSLSISLSAVISETEHLRLYKTFPFLSRS